jgi:hypothetical protein
MSENYRRRVGTVRPSHLMFTGGVGGLVDLPNFSVLIRGIDDWSYANIPNWQPINETRLLSAARSILDAPGLTELRPAPWIEGNDEPNDPAQRTGVPVAPFPQWFRCTRCNVLAALDSRTFGFENRLARRPDEAQFSHQCGRKPRLAVPARFMLACVNGHLDDFPYVEFVHAAGQCPKATHPTLRMTDRGGNLGANVLIACDNCRDERNISEALGARGEFTLPACRGRHPHLNRFEACRERPKMLVVGASNQWFADVLSVLAVPPSGASALDAKVDELWDQVKGVTSREVLDFAITQVQFSALRQWSNGEVWEAIERRRAKQENPSPFGRERPDILTPEWEIFTAKPAPAPTPDFTVRDDQVVPESLLAVLSDVVQVERLREVRALIGFTRLDAPDPEDPDVVARAPIGRAARPEWLPASEVRGEGIFLRVHEELLATWEDRVARTETARLHREAYAQFRRNRFSGRLNVEFEPMRYWPGVRYIALHTLSHMLIRAIALECGYNAASLSERIYAGTDENPRSGLLIYTAVPDSEGTLGGLVSLGEPTELDRIFRRALHDAQHCSSDPLCSERSPQPPAADFLHGAACHVCLFVSETTCERGNRFLDRRFVVPVGDPDLALLANLNL